MDHSTLAHSPLPNAMTPGEMASGSSSEAGGMSSNISTRGVNQDSMSRFFQGPFNQARRPSVATTASDSADEETLRSATFDSTESASTAPSSFPQSPENLPLSQTDEADLKLRMVLAEDDHAAVEPGLVTGMAPHRTRVDPTTGWSCAWDISGRLDNPSAIPSTKAAFGEAIALEKTAIDNVKAGLASYIAELHSGKHHTFSESFLSGEVEAFSTTVLQLNRLVEHLDDVQAELEQTHASPADAVQDELRVAFSHVQPWVVRAQAALTANHVFYKINYALCPREA